MSFSIFYLIIYTFYIYVIKELLKIVVFPVILLAPSFRDDVDEFLYSFYLYLTSIGD
jgi:hypothetical protein